MKKTFLFLVSGSLFLITPTSAFAALNFKMTADKTTLTVGETATIEVFAFADEALAVGQNGLNSWQLSMLTGGDGEVRVTSDSISLFAPFSFDSLMTSVNSPAGSIKDLAMNSKIVPVDSDLGIGGYQKIMEFIIEGTSVGEVTYTIGDTGLGLFGILRDYDPGNMATWDNYLSGTFDTAASDYRFTIIPEPATLALLGSGMGFFLLRSRKSGRL